MSESSIDRVQAIISLLQNHLVIPIEQRHLVIEREFEANLKKKALERIASNSNSFDKRQSESAKVKEAEYLVRQSLEEFKQKDFECTDAYVTRNLAESLTKRQKKDNDLNYEAVLGLNVDVVKIFLLNEEIARIASKKLPPAAAQLYSMLLMVIAPKVRSLNDSNQAVSIPSSEFIRLLPKNLILNDNSQSSMLSNFKHSDDIPSQVSAELIEEHLTFASQDDFGFLEKFESKAEIHWKVDYQAMLAAIRRYLYRKNVEQYLGQHARRILSAICAMGMSDEKMLSNRALVKQQEVRIILAQLLHLGIINIQEVPRSNDRMPSRTFYYWYHNPKHAYQILCDNICFTLCENIVLLNSQVSDNKQEIMKAMYRLEIIYHMFS